MEIGSQPLVSYLIITNNRKHDLQEAVASVLNQDWTPIEIVIVDNNSTDGTREMIRAKFDDHNINYIRLTENRGVSGGRNVSIAAAKGDILITMDDDAVIGDANATAKIVKRFSEDPDVDVLTFKIVDYFTGELQRSAFPTRDKSTSSDREFETSRFQGGGHAIPRRIYDEVGLYADYFPYAHEELDLSLRILDAGFRILFFPEVVIYHKIKEKRRKRLSGRWSIILENRIKVAIRNLPWIYVLSTGLSWSLRTLADCRGDFGPVLKAWWSLWQQRVKLKHERHPIKKETIRRVRRLRGPLFY